MRVKCENWFQDDEKDMPLTFKSYSMIIYKKCCSQAKADKAKVLKNIILLI